MKFDPYLNVDPGTMSPFQHGEVFVTDDGAETTSTSGITSASHMPSSLATIIGPPDVSTSRSSLKSAEGDYLGKTVQVIPHVTNEIKAAMKKVAQDVDVAIVEIGGTVGDIESLPLWKLFAKCARSWDARTLYSYTHAFRSYAAARRAQNKTNDSTQ